VIVLDTSGLLTAYQKDEPATADLLQVLHADRGPLILSPFVLAELDYLLLQRGGVEAELLMLSDVSRGVYRLAEFSQSDVAAAQSVADRYRDLKIGVADASIVVLAERFRTTRILTFDHRHFRAMEPLQGGSFTLLPTDSPAAAGSALP
jgi:predicted nucleic acid-binding protein